MNVPVGASGTNPFSATATNQADSAYAASDGASYTVGEVDPVTVSVAVQGSSFANRDTVPISALVNSNGPADGASVVFTMLKPDGKTSTYTATADASGTASWSYRVHPKDPTGTYFVSAEATYSGGSGASEEDAMFEVQ